VRRPASELRTLSVSLSFTDKLSNAMDYQQVEDILFTADMDNAARLAAIRSTINVLEEVYIIPIAFPPIPIVSSK
jgi:hypothetical protein